MLFPAPASRPGLTLGLHAGPDQGQGVAGYLATRAGDGATGQEHEDAWVGRVVAILLEPPVLQRLVGAKKAVECGLDWNWVTPRTTLALEVLFTGLCLLRWPGRAERPHDTVPVSCHSGPTSTFYGMCDDAPQPPLSMPLSLEAGIWYLT